MEIATPKGRGRPRTFDREAALDRAMILFWQHGYEATSLSQLTAEMGISPPSLYAAFGDKESLFLEAIERYRGRGGGDAQALLSSGKTARDAMAGFLAAAAARLTHPKFPRGCMVVLSAVSCSDEAAPIQAKLAACRATWEDEMKERIARGVAEGDLPAATDVATLAAFYMTVIQGMSLQAKDGASRQRLEAVAAAAMRAWPAKTPRKRSGIVASAR